VRSKIHIKKFPAHPGNIRDQNPSKNLRNLSV
jgi:hypothetical protein